MAENSTNKCLICDVSKLAGSGEDFLRKDDELSKLGIYFELKIKIKLPCSRYSYC